MGGKRILLFGAIIIIIILAILLIIYAIANVNAKNEYVRTYNSCVAYMEENFIINRSISQSEAKNNFAYDCIINNEGCYLPCGGCNQPTPYVKFSELFKIDRVCITSCMERCLMPPESFE